MAAKDLENGLPKQAKTLEIQQKEPEGEPRASKESIPQSISPIHTQTIADKVRPEPDAAAEQPPSKEEELNRRATHESEAPYSIFTHSQKIFIVLAVSFMAIISPLSGSAYLPALPAIAEDLNVSNNLINLTVTTYLVCTQVVSVSWNRVLIARHRYFKGLRRPLSAISPTYTEDGQPMWSAP